MKHRLDPLDGGQTAISPQFDRIVRGVALHGEALAGMGRRDLAASISPS
ncbi:hypothetical protein [Pelagicoccus sp. SDUM812002]|nr:hypothetical protein [Pelagicoccus sp. SDUM812002]MDQ8187792.1 hypothetical protein [Pelagicoccus sp. SDUM812002]